MKITCQTCNTDYFDSSPAAVAEPRSCPWCSHTTAAPSLELFTKESAYHPSRKEGAFCAAGRGVAS